MLNYSKFGWIYKAAPPGQPWQVAGGKWHAHARAGDTTSPIIAVPAPAAVGQAATKLPEDSPEEAAAKPPAKGKKKGMPKVTIRQNVWGNWYGYVGGRKVRSFPADGWGTEDWKNQTEQALREGKKPEVDPTLEEVQAAPPVEIRHT